MLKPWCAVMECTNYCMLWDVFQFTSGSQFKLFPQVDLVASSLSDYLTTCYQMFGAGKVSKFITTHGPKDRLDRAPQFLSRKIFFGVAGNFCC